LIDGKFDDWKGVTPRYLDDRFDTVWRDEEDGTRTPDTSTKQGETIS
jgi:hypothetical protein